MMTASGSGGDGSRVMESTSGGDGGGRREIFSFDQNNANAGGGPSEKGRPMPGHGAEGDMGAVADGWRMKSWSSAGAREKFAKFCQSGQGRPYDYRWEGGAAKAPAARAGGEVEAAVRELEGGGGVGGRPVKEDKDAKVKVKVVEDSHSGTESEDSSVGDESTGNARGAHGEAPRAQAALCVPQAASADCGFNPDAGEWVGKRSEVKADKPKPSRYWTSTEHDLFLRGVKLYGPRNYEMISRVVETRNAKQVRTHSQKFEMKLEREEKARVRRRSEGAEEEEEKTRTPAKTALAGRRASADARRMVLFLKEMKLKEFMKQWELDQLKETPPSLALDVGAVVEEDNDDSGNGDGSESELERADGEREEMDRHGKMAGELPAKAASHSADARSGGSGVISALEKHADEKQNSSTASQYPFVSRYIGGESQSNKQSRYWTNDEHNRFLQGVMQFGPRKYQQISAIVGTRTSRQVRTHSQKFEKKLEREHEKRERSKLRPTSAHAADNRPLHTPGSGDFAGADADETRASISMLEFARHSAEFPRPPTPTGKRLRPSQPGSLEPDSKRRAGEGTDDSSYSSEKEGREGGAAACPEKETRFSRKARLLAACDDGDGNGSGQASSTDAVAVDAVYQSWI